MHALDACKLLKANGVKFNYQIIGGADDMELLYQIHDLELQAEVQLFQMDSLDSVKLMMENSDVFFLPSLKEDRADVVFQAMASNLIVLAIDCEFTKDMIIDGHSGFIVPMRDTYRMAECLESILNLSEPEKNRIRKNAKKIVKVNLNERIG